MLDTSRKRVWTVIALVVVVSAIAVLSVHHPGRKTGPTPAPGTGAAQQQPAPPPPVSMEELLPGTWEYANVAGSRNREEYLLRLTLDDNGSADDAEFRLLLDRAGPEDFCCLRLAQGKATLVKVREGFQTPLVGQTEALIDGDLAGLRIDVYRLPGSWVVAWGGRDRILAVDPERRYGPAAVAAAGAVTVANIRVQPLAPIHYRDDFTRKSFAPNGLYDVWSGKWSLRVGDDTDRSVNAFQARAAGKASCFAVFGHPFWREFRTSVSLLYRGQGAAGLVWSATSPDHFGLVRWTRHGPGDGELEILAHAGGQDRVLKRVPWVPRSNQWYRLTLELSGNAGRVTVGDQDVNFRIPPEMRGGRVGLFADTSAGVLFDDVACDSIRATEPDAGPVLTSMLKARLLFPDEAVHRTKEGELLPPRKYEGQDSWLNDDQSWERLEAGLSQRTLFWGPVHATATVDAPRKEGETLSLRMASPEDGGFVQAVSVSRLGGELRIAGEGTEPTNLTDAMQASGPEDGKVTLELRRIGASVEALVNGQRVRTTPCPGDGPAQIALHGAKVAPECLEIKAANLAGSVFEDAPTSWVRWAGHWGVSSKWQCAPGWTYMGLWSDHADTYEDVAGVWTRQSFHGDQDLQFYVALKDMLGQKIDKRRYVRRDINFAFCTDGKSLNSGYCVLLAGYGNRGTQLLRRGKVVCENTSVRIPTFTGDHHDIHWRWWHCRMVRRGNVIQFLVDNKEVLRYEDPDPLPGGHVGLWTVGNGLIVTRTRFTWEETGDSLPGFDMASPQPAEVAGFAPFPTEHPVRLRPSALRPGAVEVTNAAPGGPMAVTFKTPGPAAKQEEEGAVPPLWLSYCVPEDVVAYLYTEAKGNLRRTDTPELARGALRSDGKWHCLPLDTTQLKEGERFAIGCREGQQYLCAGLGGNDVGASYWLSLSPPGPVLPGVSAKASSTHQEWPGEGSPGALVDGDLTTRWSSDYADGEDVTLDLGKETRVSALQLFWESSAAKDYTVSVSKDGKTWQSAREVKGGKPGPRADEVDLGGVRTRFIRLGLKQRTSEWGFSLYEISILP